MKIRDILNKDTATISFEVFPPKKSTDFGNVEAAALGIAALQPAYMSVTYGAGGSTKGHTIALAGEIQKQHNVPTVAHLTCVCADRSSIGAALTEMQAAGIENILALRGDIPKEAVTEETCQTVTNFVEYENHTCGYENHTRYIESDLPQTNLPFSDLSAKPKSDSAASYEKKLEQAQTQVTSEKTKRFGSKAIAEIAAILAWVAKTAKKTLKVGGVEMQTETVREKLQTLTAEQTAEVMKNTANRKIRNRRSYLLTCLYHAADSMAASAIPRSENADAYESFIFNLC